jgi:hypothetical protein
MTVAAIAVFAFNRPDHLGRLLDSLLSNPQFHSSPLYLFVDGPRDCNDNKMIQEVQNVIESKLINVRFDLIQREINLGLSRSLIEGISKILNIHDKVIVLEDDLVVSPKFIEFCNEGLVHYEMDLKVASIQGYSKELNYDKHDTYFLRGADCWGWATWKNRWQEFQEDADKLYQEIHASGLEKVFDVGGAYPYTNMLIRQARGKLDSWAIRWHASMFLSNRLSLYPTTTLVDNLGRDGSGIHAGDTRKVNRNLNLSTPKIGDIPILENNEVLRKYEKALRSEYKIYSFRSPHKYREYLSRILNKLLKESTNNPQIN